MARGLAVAGLTVLLVGCGAAAPPASPTPQASTSQSHVSSAGAGSPASGASIVPSLSAPASPTSASAAAPTPGSSASAPPSAWTRPDNPPTIAPASVFKVVSQTASPGDKAPVFFMGAQFCPYCAAERWALVSALQRFGTMTGYGKEMSNDGIDGFKPVPTYDLRAARYDSLYVSFSDKEIFDHNSKPLDPLSSGEKAYVNQWDPSGGWPFIVINGQYAGLGPGYSPALLQGQTFDGVAGQLQRGDRNAATDAILKEASVISAYVCAATGGFPRTACQG
ncbi:MAG: DUF929 family protein [Chloroflexi bacterium]|nr:DUF929 family protein [Chloroflexota bacterium]